MVPEIDLTPVHTREYLVRGYYLDASTLLIRGTVRDVLPADFYDADDPELLVMHHMVVDLTVSLADLSITDAAVKN